MSNYTSVLASLPYAKPFHFVDELTSIDESGAQGSYTIREDEYFFKGHFPDHPVVPGVILTEIMAQIGLVCLAIHLLQEKGETSEVLPAFTSSNVDFLKKVSPKDKLIIESKKVYFRFGKLKCQISCKFPDGTIVAKGEFSGMIVKKQDIEKA
ncbi:MAG: 3-hydroxyacyl-ACP dehydratase FabZ family protein [Ekhidna sp.]